MFSRQHSPTQATVLTRLHTCRNLAPRRALLQALLKQLIQLFRADRFRQIPVHPRRQASLFIALHRVRRQRNHSAAALHSVSLSLESAPSPPSRPSPASVRPSAPGRSPFSPRPAAPPSRSPQRPQRARAFPASSSPAVGSPGCLPPAGFAARPSTRELLAPARACFRQSAFSSVAPPNTPATASRSSDLRTGFTRQRSNAQFLASLAVPPLPR